MGEASVKVEVRESAVNSGNGVIIGPGLNKKNTAIRSPSREPGTLQFRAELFNA